MFEDCNIIIIGIPEGSSQLNNLEEELLLKNITPTMLISIKDKLTPPGADFSIDRLVFGIQYFKKFLA